MPVAGVHELKYAVIDTASSGDNTIVAAVAGKRIVLLGYTIIATGAVTARWKSGASTNLSGAMAFAANGGTASGGSVESPQLQTARGEALVLNLGGAVQASGHITYALVG